MTRRPPSRYLCRLSFLLLMGLLAAGCAMRESPAVADIDRARTAINEAKGLGAPPERVADLERRHLQARSVYYACQDAEASRLAQAIINDVNALRPRPVAAAAPPPPPPANQPPRARIAGPNEAEVNALVNFSGEGSSDPDPNDKLAYMWDFGDGTTASFTFPNATHRYARAGNYTVRLTVDDGRGGTDSATKPITVIRRILLQDRAGKVLFDFNKATLRPAAQQELASVVQEVQENPTLRVELVGHADAVGSDTYNDGLSRRRAEAVRNYLVSRGIAANRITVAWRGEREPIAPNTTAEGRAQNRRVEITLRPTPVQ